MSYRLDDPGTGPISVADARKCPQAPPVHWAYAKFVGREISSPLGIPKTLPSDH